MAPTHFRTCANGHQWVGVGDGSAVTAARCPQCGAKPEGDATLPPLDLCAQPCGAYPDKDAADVGLDAALPGYELLDKLGHGGMGVVYKARQLGLDRVVALKMILASGHAAPADLARFQTEAEALARLQHANIVPVYEVGKYAGRPFFSMEFLEGGSLADKLDGRPWPQRSAAELVATLASAVHAAHQRGVIHRDLKPANVLLSADTTPKISDFGLAKRLDRDSSPEPQSAEQTRCGTPGYMAPEQVAGQAKEIGPATDVYALGAILYELLTGRAPFSAATPIDTVLRTLNGDLVLPRKLNRNASRDLEAVCLKCLQRNPENRYSSAEALAADLHRYLGGEHVSARRLGPIDRVKRWAQHRPALAATLLALAVFYTSHFLELLVPAANARSYHIYVTGIVLVWAVMAVAFQWLIERPRWHTLGVFSWAAMDVVLFTALLWVKGGPSSPLVGGYLLLIGVAATRFRARLVWFVTELALTGYTVLVADAYRQRPHLAPTTPQTPVIFAMALILMGLVMSLLLRRSRAFTQAARATHR